MYTTMNVGAVKHRHFAFQTPQFTSASGVLQVHRNANKEVADICFIVLRSLGNAFPESFNTIRIETFKRESEDETAALTSVSKKEKAATIKLALLPDADLKSDSTVRGEIAQTFVHEVVLHALPDLISYSQNKKPEDETVQHRNTYAPPDENNPYHKTIKKILSYIPKDMKKAFLIEYATDVYDQLLYDTEPTDPEAQAGYAWAELLEANAENPLSSYWRN